MSQNYIVGDEVAFFYNGTQRLVEVVKATDTYITGKSLNPLDVNQFKSYTISKMQSPVKVKK